MEQNGLGAAEGWVDVLGGEGGRRYRLWGRGLRLVLDDELMRRPVMTVAELVEAIEGLGYELGGRASKVISDALRWEVAAGRVERVGRGVYRFVQAHRSRIRRMRRFVSLCRLWLVAATRGLPLPVVPPPRSGSGWRTYLDPKAPPWDRIGWVWGT